MEREGSNAGDVAGRLVWLLADSDLGAPSQHLRELKGDSNRSGFRAAWADSMREAVATADTGRMRALLLTSDDSKRFPRTPIAALMDADSEAWRALAQALDVETPQGRLGVTVCHTAEFTDAAAAWLAAVSLTLPGGIAGGDLVTIPDVSLGAARRSLAARLQEAADVPHAGDEYLLPPLVRPMAAGSNQLNAGLLIATLESGRPVIVLDMIIGSQVAHAITFDPMNWLLRRRYFSAAADIEPDGDRRDRLQRLEWSKDLRNVSHRGRPLLEGTRAVVTVFFDHAASRSVQAVLMARSALAAEGLKVGRRGTVGSKRPQFADALNDDSLGKSRAKALTKLASRATPKSGQPHPLRPLPINLARRLRFWEDTWPGRRAPHSGTADLVPFSATPSGRLLMIRGVGTRELDAQGRSPFVDSITQEVLTQAIADTLAPPNSSGLAIQWGTGDDQFSVDELLVASHATEPIAHQAAATVDTAITEWRRIHVSTLTDEEDVPQSRDEIVEAARTTAAACPPDPPDLVVGLVGPGRPTTQMAVLLGAAEVAVSIGAPFVVGSMRQPSGRDESRSIATIDRGTVAQFAGWRENLRPLTRQLVEELEFPAAVEALNAAGEAESTLAKDIRKVWDDLTRNRSNDELDEEQRGLVAAQRVILVRQALLSRDPFLCAQWAASVVELTVGLKMDTPSTSREWWVRPALLVLYQVRNDSPGAHGAFPANVDVTVERRVRAWRGSRQAGSSPDPLPGVHSLGTLLDRVVADLLQTTHLPAPADSTGEPRPSRIDAQSDSPVSSDLDRLVNAWQRILNELGDT